MYLGGVGVYPPTVQQTILMDRNGQGQIESQIVLSSGQLLPFPLSKLGPSSSKTNYDGQCMSIWNVKQTIERYIHS
jgi:hypothetical protein